MINSMVLIVAGSDTAATLLSGLFYLLLRNPGCLQKITHEIRSAFNAEDEINFLSVQNLPYSMFLLGPFLFFLLSLFDEI